MADCSELEQKVVELTMLIAQDSNLKTVDDVVAEFPKYGLEGIPVEFVVDAVVASARTKEQLISDAARNMRQIRQQVWVADRTKNRIKQLEKDLEAGRLPEKAKRGETLMGAYAAELKAIEAQLKQDMKNSDPAKIAALNKRLESAQERIATLREQGITVKQKTKQFGPETEAVTEVQQELEAALEEEKAVRAEIRNSLENRKNVLKRQVTNLHAKLEANDYGPEIVNEVKEIDSEMVKLMEDRQRLRHEINVRVADQGKSAVIKGLAEANSVIRALKATLDLGAFGRQGGFFNATHPQVAKEALVRSYGAVVGGDAEAQAIYDNIWDRDNAALYRDAGLFFAAPEADLSKREENFSSGLVQAAINSKNKAISGPAQLIAASERGHNALLNSVRADMFDVMVHGLTAQPNAPTPAELKAIGDFINYATGRGAKPAGTLGDALLFSQRWMFSRLQMLGLSAQIPTRMATRGVAKALGKDIFTETARTDKIIAGELTRYSIGLAAFLALAAAAGLSEDDPTSSDFGKIKLGNQRLDMLSAFGQYITLGSRIATQTSKSPTTGVKREMSGRDLSGAMANTLIWYKLAPFASATKNLLTRENAVGENRDVTTGEGALGLLKDVTIPLQVEDFMEQASEYGLGEGFVRSIPGFFGFGGATFGPSEDVQRAIDEAGSDSAAGAQRVVSAAEKEGYELTTPFWDAWIEAEKYKEENGLRGINSKAEAREAGKVREYNVLGRLRKKYQAQRNKAKRRVKQP